MNILYYMLQQSWKLLAFATVSSVIAGVSGAALVAVISQEINAFGQQPALVWIFFALCLSCLVFKSCSEISLLHLTQTTVCDMRISLSRKLLATMQKKQQTLGKSSIFAILTSDVNVFMQAFQVLPLIISDGIIVTSCLAYMAWISWKTFIVFALCLIIGATGYHYAEQRPLRLMVNIREQTTVLFQNFRDLIEGSKELQLNKRRGQGFVEQVISPGAWDYCRLYVKCMSGYSLVTNFGTVVFYVAIGVTLFLLPQLLALSVDVVVTSTLLLLYLLRPMSELMGALPSLRQAAISLKKIQQLDCDLSPDIADHHANNPFSSRSPLQLKLNEVCHQYPGLTEDSHFTLGPVDLSIHQGELLFIVGGNGSGKTTLAMLILGLYTPEQGTVSLNGLTVVDSNLEHYREHFSAVFSDFHLFEQLLGIDQEDIGGSAMRYLQLLHLAHKVNVVDGKYSTTSLSTGQRKRLALVSAYLEDRPIYLFDEWAADQDPVFKRVFYTELLPELKARGKTVLVITHDDVYFSVADRIVKLEDGHVRPFVEQPPLSRADLARTY
jgi:putative ATP-binding cassette transporter